MKDIQNILKNPQEMSKYVIGAGSKGTADTKFLNKNLLT